MVSYRLSVVVLFMVLTGHVRAFADLTDTLFPIEAVEVQGLRFEEYQSGASVYELDSLTLSLYQGESISGLLSAQSPAVVKEYGPGGLSGISIRGGGSHHASVVWNNINIQSPMHGGVNFTTLPTCFVDRAFIQLGGASTLFGSGTASGSIHLEDDLAFRKGPSLILSVSAGSPRDYFHSGKTGISSKRFASSLKYYFRHNENSFTYRNPYLPGEKKPVEKLTHGGFRQYGLAQSNKISLSRTSWLGSSIWILDHSKEIPALMSTFKPSEADQKERNLLYSVYYRKRWEKVQFKLQSGGFYNQVLYHNVADIGIIDNNNFSFSYINFAELLIPVRSATRLGFILEQKHEQGNSGAYRNRHIRDVLSAVASLNYSGPKLAATITFREELVNGKPIPLVFSAGMDYRLTEQWMLKSQVSKNYSLPTFNDLYWYADEYSKGNPDLAPESGWSADAGIHFLRRETNYALDLSTTYFANFMDNWIRWIPDSSGIWTPVNLQEALSHGVETGALYRYQIRKGVFDLRIRYTWNAAFVTRLEGVDITSKSQMSYIPEHHCYLAAGLTVGRFRVSYNQSYFSRRATDNAGGSLQGYTLGNAGVRYSLPLNSAGKLEFSLRIQNLWNTDYEVSKGYAMPLRHYYLGINYLLF